MTQTKNNKCLCIPVKYIEDKELKEKFLKILPLIEEITNRRCNDFGKSVKKFKNDGNYEFKHALIERHFS